LIAKFSPKASFVFGCGPGLIHCIGHPLWSAITPGGGLVQGHGGQGVPITIDAHHDGECNLAVVLDLLAIFADLAKEGIFGT
jgi:hypothetical protein